MGIHIELTTIDDLKADIRFACSKQTRAWFTKDPQYCP